MGLLFNELRLILVLFNHGRFAKSFGLKYVLEEEVVFVRKIEAFAGSVQQERKEVRQDQN